MKFTQTEVEHIAQLARIELAEAEKQRFSRELSSVLEYMEILNEVDTKDAEPTSQVTGLLNVFREDRVHPCDPMTVEKIKENFPSRAGDLLRVPAVFKEYKEQRRTSYESE